ncbi:MAG: 16S rRNA (cytosine(1402)-N(4))-methyltransferase RsmH [Acidobacteria bacterium]|nr:MAG: 16S rRNA (cytosine(1402)-N(4))-methyltransferase RsmH [Acidobacteriota bacterium]
MIFESQRPEEIHIPVLLDEVIEYLVPMRGGIFVDATIGLGGHAEALLSTNEAIHLVGIDRDKQVLELAEQRLARFQGRFKLVHANFVDIKLVLKDSGLDMVDGIIADLGVSSFQLGPSGRGFSFRFDEPLDMRMDIDSKAPTAAELLQNLEERELADLLFSYGEERFARRIARKIVERRKTGNPITTTRNLVELIEAVIGKRSGAISSATRTFQALRIAVNDELANLKRFIFEAIDVLRSSGRLAVISFHSLEDRIVKQSFQELSKGENEKIKVLTRKPIRATSAEIKENPKSRSAKLRVGEKI